LGSGTGLGLMFMGVLIFFVVITALMLYMQSFEPPPTINFEDTQNAEATQEQINAPTLYGEASWYSRKECCTKSNPDSLMANRKPLDDDALTCAMWLFEFGTKLKITCGDKSVVCVVSDRGPNRRFKKRIVDLSRAAFQKISSLEKGLCLVKVTVVE